MLLGMEGGQIQVDCQGCENSGFGNGAFTTLLIAIV